MAGKHKDYSFHSRDMKNKKILKLVIMRVVTLLMILFSCVSLGYAIILRPWKSESIKKSPWTLEIGPWNICKHMFFRETCFSPQYEKNAKTEIWFQIWRYGMVVAMVMLLITFIYICVELMRLSNRTKKPWLIASLACFVSALINLVCLSLFYGYRKFEFIDPFRMQVMGWTSVVRLEDHWIETYSIPLKMCWCSEASMLVTTVLCAITRVVENSYIINNK